MTAPAGQAAPYRTAVAQSGSVCAVRECRCNIEPGMLIVKYPGRGWQHASCDDPHRGRRRVSAGQDREVSR